MRHDNCPTCQCDDEWPCAWCRRPMPLARQQPEDWPSGYCSEGCYDAWRKHNDRRGKVRALARFDAKVQAGRRVCTAHRRGGGPCNASPVLGADRCIQHAADDVLTARATGIAYGDMAVDDELCRALRGGDPLFDVIDAYRRREILRHAMGWLR